MQLYNLGKVPWQESQLMYHALAALGRESLALVSPATPYVCVGYHQDVSQEVDLDFCKANNIPVFRRELGGGAVYLDGNQLFFQLILRPDNPIVPADKNKFYRKFLQPIINVYRRIGIPAEYQSVNDVVVHARKISGTGVGEIGACIAFVGNIIIDFNSKMMSRILNVPDEKFRDKVQKTIDGHLTTIRRELGEKENARWDEKKLNNLLVEEFEKIVGGLHPHEKDPVLQVKMDAMGSQMMRDAWLHQKGRRVSGRSVKIRSGVTVLHKIHKAPGGLMRLDVEVNEGQFDNVSISGDFFSFPRSAIGQLEADLEGKHPADAASVFTDFYSRGDTEIPGIGIDDWLQLFGIRDLRMPFSAVHDANAAIYMPRSS